MLAASVPSAAALPVVPLHAHKHTVVLPTEYTDPLLLRLSCPCLPLPSHKCMCVQAKQDMEQVKQMASGAVSKLSSMAGRFMNDLSRY
jgi:hypothetical protein